MIEKWPCALPLELSNAPTLVTKEAKEAHAKTRLLDTHLANIKRLTCKILARSSLILQESCKNLARVRRLSCNNLARVRRLSCKILAYPTAILQDLVRWCVTLQDSCKILQTSRRY